MLVPNWSVLLACFPCLGKWEGMSVFLKSHVGLDSINKVSVQILCVPSRYQYVTFLALSLDCGNRGQMVDVIMRKTVTLMPAGMPGYRTKSGFMEGHCCSFVCLRDCDTRRFGNDYHSINRSFITNIVNTVSSQCFVSFQACWQQIVISEANSMKNKLDIKSTNISHCPENLLD